MSTPPTDLFLALGANLKDPLVSIKKTLQEIEQIEGLSLVSTSSFYATTPVSDIPQPNYINAACHCVTTLPLSLLWQQLQAIEQKIGKGIKAKNAPRVIDIDILFYSNQRLNLGDLEIPHPRWQERLFVLRPLRDLTATVTLQGEAPILLDTLLENFSNPHSEEVFAITPELCYTENS